MKIKKIPSYFLLSLLATGACLTVGFLSFSGMYVVFPLLGLAGAAAGLSVYEWQIFFTNINGALNKLIKPAFLRHHLARAFLLEKLSAGDSPLNALKPLNPGVADDCPQFFREYAQQLQLLASYKQMAAGAGDSGLNLSEKEKKKKIKKNLRDMEKWFALQLFPAANQADTELTSYEQELHIWLAANNRREWQTTLETRQRRFRGAGLLSVVAASFMGLGTSYLLVEAFTIIPFFAAIPLALFPPLIVPMAIIAGIAYGFLIYNAVTDMINNDTLRKWYRQIRNDLEKGLTFRGSLIAVAAVLLFALSVALTICTAGTWWTVAKNARPLFDFMNRIPVVIKVINALVLAFSQLIFVLENINESLEMIDDALKAEKGIFTRIIKAINNGLDQLIRNENWLQIINIPRFLLKITITPLRILLFLGHLISIGVTSDRVPGIPEVLSALMGIINEGFEDLHYFFGKLADDDSRTASEPEINGLLEKRLKPGGCGHDHDTDILTLGLKLVFSPLYYLAAAWDSWASRRQSDLLGLKSIKALDFKKSLAKQKGEKKTEGKSGACPDRVIAVETSHDWQIQQACYHIEKHINRRLGKAVSAETKVKDLNDLKAALRNNKLDGSKTVAAYIENEAANGKKSYNTHRFFGKGPTRTTAFLEELSTRLAASPPPSA